MKNRTFYQNAIQETGNKIEKLNYWDQDPYAQYMNINYKKHLILSLYSLHGQYAIDFPYTIIN